MKGERGRNTEEYMNLDVTRRQGGGINNLEKWNRRKDKGRRGER